MLFRSLLPVLLLLAAQVVQTLGLLPRLTIWPFWLLAGLFPALLLLRNHLAHCRLRRATRALSGIGAQRPAAILFRCSGPEIHALATLADKPEETRAWLAERSSAELRWRVIHHRFLSR